MGGGSFEKGCVSPFSLLSDRFHVKYENGNYIGSNGVSSITQISDNAAIVKLVTGTESLYFFSYDENGNITKLENSSIDFIKYSDFRYFLEIALVITPIISLVIMVLLLVIHIFRLKRCKEPEERRFKLCEINLSISVMAIAAAVILIGFYGIYNKILRAAFCIAATVFLAIMLTMVVFCLRRRLKKTINPVLILECVCCFFITVSFIYWRNYQFWGF